MTVEYNYKVKNKGFLELKNEALVNLFIELYNIQNRISSVSKIEIFQNECKLTDIFKKLLDICNNNVFVSFNLELRMEKVNEDVY